MYIEGPFWRSCLQEQNVDRCWGKIERVKDDLEVRAQLEIESSKYGGEATFGDLVEYLAKACFLRAQSLRRADVQSGVRSDNEQAGYADPIKHHPPDAVAKEWRALQRLLPPDPAIASSLPIPQYYGLFHIHGQDIMVTSDDGLPLSSLVGDGDDENAWSTEMESAVSRIREAGISPTDVGLHNAVWNGTRVTIIDFVDDDRGAG
ncbi:hypothetical protein L227DRAFT_618150 [Lentinus tigrinus ALCF2SS1-6]|uniref:Uncharacterized protein n=1 Tax=Lentinus tigrinus ALCF2SS1-6 TaxID=1328759 RepID=A0A5C2RL49_9APHY|nr:hypothetical protein L227DRAFT_618150 [Lentinus tigrinus ALCF2SS1-6]